MRLLCIAGLPGSGKSTVSSILREMGFRVFIMGDYVRREAVRMGVSSDEAASMLRVKYGARIVANLVIQDLAGVSDARVAVEGLRSREEYEAFRDYFGDVKLIFIVASLKERFRRLSSRGRQDDPKLINDLLVRDYRESLFGLTSLINLADYIILNEGLSLNDLRSLVSAIVKDAYGDSSA